MELTYEANLPLLRKLAMLLAVNVQSGTGNSSGKAVLTRDQAYESEDDVPVTGPSRKTDE